MKKDKNLNFPPKSGDIQYKSASADRQRALPRNNASTNLYEYNGNTAENKMLIDEVVGGGHMIQVQDEGIDQFSQFNIAKEHGLAANESKTKYGEQGEKTAFEDNFGRVPSDFKPEKHDVTNRK